MIRPIMYIQYKMVAIGRTTLLCLLLSFFSCTNELLMENPSQPEQGIPVQVELNFRIPKFENPQQTKTRAAAGQPSGNGFHVALVADSLQSEPDKAQPATRATNAPLYNLWVLQFADNGNVRKVVRISTDENPVYENQTIEAELFVGSNQTIYLLSLGKRYGHINLSSIQTVKELESMSFDFIRYENGLPTPMIKSAEDVPYHGSCHKLSIIQLEENGKGYVDYENSNGFPGAINLKALVSLVTIDFTYQVENMTPFSISLNNVPTTFAVNNATHKPSQFVSLPTTLLNPDDLANGKRVSISWYMAPNPQGTVSSITSEADRYFYYKANATTPTGTAPRDGTYIHVWASKDATPDNYALYYLFLGSNTTSDFNVHPHSHYRYRTDINTADDLNDKRIIYKTLRQSVDFSVSAAKPPQPNLLRVGTTYNLDAHPDMRPIEITALRGTVSVEILPGSDNGMATTWPAADASSIDPSSSWLKLSVYPNYTEALSASQKGDPNGLATSINLDASIPGLFKLYLYSDEYEKYVHDNANNNAHKRSLFVRFTFRTETNTSQAYTARMDQQPAFYLGEFGGIPAMNGGVFSYPKGLAIEAKSEYTATKYLSYMPNSFPMYGAYNIFGSHSIPSDNDMHRYGAYDTHNGRLPTIMMAENKYGISPIAPGINGNQIQEPRYVNGHVDLYQYKYYTNDGFAQRWCYDKNRDNNGNGRLDDDEIVWYMPSIWQLLSIPLNCYTTSTDYLRDQTANGIYQNMLNSTTMYNRTNRMSFSFYTAQTSHSTGVHNQIHVRCVRDVEPIVGGPKGVTYYEKDGYPVIDATGLMEGVAEDRVDNPNVVITPGPGDAPTYTGRVIRHYMPDEIYEPDSIPDISRKVSQRFRVSPCDVDSLGKQVPVGTWVSMTWAQAAGYVTDANTLTITSDKTGIAETGCAAYRGKDGTDPVGKWRLPTVREAFLIGMMDKAMESDKARTGYIPLYYFDDESHGCKYWTASERPNYGSHIHNAHFLYAEGRVIKNVLKNNPAAWGTFYTPKSTTYKDQSLARCIYDLH